MKNKTVYKNAPKEFAEDLKAANIVKDFLPPPGKLVFKNSSSKITISLSDKSISFFKNESKKVKVPYQQMIRALLDKYAEHYQH